MSALRVTGPWEYITCIFEDNFDVRFHLWNNQKYKLVMVFLKKFRLCDIDVISQEKLIAYDTFVKEATREYHELVN